MKKIWSMLNSIFSTPDPTVQKAVAFMLDSKFSYSV